ncbi:MAG: hypothetical protein M3N28_03410 [Actinomycetota bacterium]|nr:hypothetical protein [Actinomycetota bacterium]
MDLSKLLGDLYETDHTDETDSPPDGMSEAPSSQPAPGPEWANEARLDEAFASWKPGPPDDAPAAEREMADHYQDTSPSQLQAALPSDAQLDGDVLNGDRMNGAGEYDPGSEFHELKDLDLNDLVPSGLDPNQLVPEEQGSDDQVETEYQPAADGVVPEPVKAGEPDVDADDPLTGPSPVWSRANDDVLPNRRGGRRARRFSLRRR